MSGDFEVQVRKVSKVNPAANAYSHGNPLSYRYDSPLRVGDRVMCPGNEWSGPFLAEVVALGRGSFDGSLRSLLCRVAPDRKRP